MMQLGLEMTGAIPHGAMPSTWSMDEIDGYNSWITILTQRQRVKLSCPEY